MQRNYFLLLVFLCLIIGLQKANGQFVQRALTTFTFEGKPYHYVGANYWYGSYLANSEKNKARLRKELDFLVRQGVTNLRVLGASEGDGRLVNRFKPVGPAVQPGQGVFNEKALAGLDYLLAEMSRRNMKAVIYFSNNWEWSGGFLQYLNWNGRLPDSIMKRKLTWDENRDVVKQFYDCDSCKEAYAKQVRLILNRTNTLTKKEYRNDPTIMAWQLANEPRPMRRSAERSYVLWIKETAAMIKKIDKKHLLSLGVEGEKGTETLGLFEEIHTDPNIDYLTIHIWPKNWRWFKDTLIAQSFPGVIDSTKQYLQKHLAIANKLQKPLVVEEFGLPRNNLSFSPGSSTSLRDSYYSLLFSLLRKSIVNNGAFAGCNFWAFGGMARPKMGQVYWKAGDAYMGDPPPEEQGLNTVFDSDSTTWEIIHRAISSLNAAVLPIDQKATAETKNLYRNLRKLMNKGILFGHQDDLAYGVGWEYEQGRSDVKSITGTYPAVYGWELGHLELDSTKNLDGIPFKKMIQYIKEVYKRGGINTISWHLNDPVTGATAWSKPTSTVKEILPGGVHHAAYKNYLDKLAEFLQQLKTPGGKRIPVIFRPFHEHTGDWFWWGAKYCTPEEYIKLWRFTVAYLKDQKQLHHLLYAYSAAGYKTEAEYAARYPGNEYVDIVGFDAYCNKDVAAFANDLDNRLNIVDHFADAQNKIPALTEVGYNQIPQADWWSQTLFPVIKKYKLSYLLTWRNWKEEHYFAPYPGQKSEADFVKFYNLPQMIFQDRLTPMKVYDK